MIYWVNTLPHDEEVFMTAHAMHSLLNSFEIPCPAVLVTYAPPVEPTRYVYSTENDMARVEIYVSASQGSLCPNQDDQEDFLEQDRLLSR